MALPACSDGGGAATGLARLLALLPAEPGVAVVNDYAAARAAVGLERPTTPSEAGDYRLEMTNALFMSPAPLAVGGEVAFGDVDGDARLGDVEAVVGAFGTRRQPDEAPDRTLADVDALRTLASALEAEGAYAAALTTDTGAFARDAAVPDDVPPDVAEAVARQVLLRPYEAVASGVGRDADGPYVVLVFVHADDEAAAENVGRLRRIVLEGDSFAAKRPWRDLFDVASIEADGPVVTARLPANVGRLWLDVVLGGDSLLWWA